MQRAVSHMRQNLQVDSVYCRIQASIPATYLYDTSSVSTQTQPQQANILAASAAGNSVGVAEGHLGKGSLDGCRQKYYGHFRGSLCSK